LYYNEAMFARQAKCGYILKPPHLLDASQKTASPITKLTVTVIDARSLPKKRDESSRPVIDPKVRVTMLGCTKDRREFTTKVIVDNGYSPEWNETFAFPVTETFSVRI